MTRACIQCGEPALKIDRHDPEPIMACPHCGASHEVTERLDEDARIHEFEVALVEQCRECEDYHLVRHMTNGMCVTCEGSTA